MARNEFRMLKLLAKMLRCGHEMQAIAIALAEGRLPEPKAKERLEAHIRTMTGIGERALLEATILGKRLEGYRPTRWIATPKGVRADRSGKISVPSHYSANRVCMEHGNYTMARSESDPESDKSGIIVLDVLPCTHCADAGEAAERIIHDPVTNTSKSISKKTSSAKLATKPLG